MAIHGSCLCTAVTFTVADNFDHFFICHCQHCQKDTGSAFAANLFINADAITWLTGKEHIRHFQLPSTRHARSFCATCGSALPYIMTDNLTAVVPAGSLNSPPTNNPMRIFLPPASACGSLLLPVFARLNSFLKNRQS